MKTKVLLMQILTALILFIFTGDLSAQMKFKDLVGHPVLTYGDEGEWDDEYVWAASIIKDGDTLRMWYHGSRGDFGEPDLSKIGYAWSLDGIVWNKYDENPVLTATLAWEGGWVQNPIVIKDGDTLKMWYDSMEQGYAESFDGINWTKHPVPVVLTEGPQSEWDDGFLWVNSVIKEGDEYKMWYSGGRPGFPGVDSYPQVGFATSPDGLNWIKYDDPSTQNAPYAFSDPVLKPGEENDWDQLRAFVPSVVKTDTGYTMFYTGVNEPPQTYIKQQIGLAYSTDGIHWTKDDHNPIIKDDHSVVKWGGGIYTGTALYYHERFHVWFGCENSQPYIRRPQIGYAMQLTSCFPLDFEFTTQAEIDSFQVNCNNCNEIQGDVTISGTDITDLSGLRFVTSIGGYINIHNNNSLASLAGLDNLTSITGDLIIGGWWPYGNNALQSLNGLNNLTFIGGGMVMASNPLLKNLNGIGSLTSIGEGLRIGNCDAKGNNDVTGQIYSDSLQSLTGLENLVTIGGPLSLTCNSSLVSLEGLEKLDSIGGLWINVPVTSLKELNNLSYIGDGGVVISGTDLTSLTGLENVIFSESSLDIMGNDFLCECDIKSLCNFLENNPPENINISQNASGCNSQEEVQSDCNNNCLAGGINFNSQAEIDAFTVNYPTCTEIEGNVTIHGGTIMDLDSLNRITTIGGSLSIFETKLTSLAGFENLEYIGGNLTINWNDQLSTCDAEGICKCLANPNGTVKINNNASGCNSQEEVREACIFGVDESAVINQQSAVRVYPNPAPGIVDCQLSIVNNQRITLKIYDLHGREVATVVDEVMPAGEHVLRFDAGSLIPSIYFYRLTTGSQSATGKLVVVR